MKDMIFNRYAKLVDNNLMFNDRRIGYIDGDTIYINYKDYQLKGVHSINFQENLKLNVVTDFKNRINI